MAKRLWNHIETHLGFQDSTLQRIGRQRIHATIGGLHTQAHLYNLICLKDEDYLWDEVLDAGIEILSLRYNLCQSPENSGSGRLLVFPTTLFTDLQQLKALAIREGFHPEYTDPMSCLRSSLRSPAVRGCLFVIADSNHYSGYKWLKGKDSYEYCDTLDLPPPPYTHSHWKWLTAGISSTSMSSQPVFSNTAPTFQPPGSGSCGIAVLNWLERQLGLTMELWEPSRSSEFRNNLLTTFLLWHIASQEEEVSSVSFMNEITGVLLLTAFLLGPGSMVRSGSGCCCHPSKSETSETRSWAVLFHQLQ